jgi:hypothetical protein
MTWAFFLIFKRNLFFFFFVPFAQRFRRGGIVAFSGALSEIYKTHFALYFLLPLPLTLNLF